MDPILFIATSCSFSLCTRPHMEGHEEQIRYNNKSQSSFTYKLT